jgi:uncharacterized protein DUF1153
VLRRPGRALLPLRMHGVLTTKRAVSFYQNFRAGGVFSAFMRKRGDTKLPPSNTRRWTIRRKAALIAAIRGRALTLEQARRRYSLSVEELSAWERDFDQHGMYGLRATRLQIYRRDK